MTCITFISHDTRSQMKSNTSLQSLAHTVLTFILHNDCVAEVNRKSQYSIVMRLYFYVFMPFYYPRFYIGVIRSISVLSRGRSRSCRDFLLSCARSSLDSSHHFDSVTLFPIPPSCSVFVQYVSIIRVFLYRRRFSKTQPLV
jgi:hypothetical protein